MQNSTINAAAQEEALPVKRLIVGLLVAALYGVAMFYITEVVTFLTAATFALFFGRQVIYNPSHTPVERGAMVLLVAESLFVLYISIG